MAIGQVQALQIETVRPILVRIEYEHSWNCSAKWVAATGNTSGSTNQQPSQLQGNNNGNARGFGNASNRAQQLQGGGGGAFGSGTPSPFRLFSVSLGGQIAWLLPFALLAIVTLACQKRFNFHKDRQQQVSFSGGSGY